MRALILRYLEMESQHEARSFAATALKPPPRPSVPEQPPPPLAQALFPAIATYFKFTAEEVARLTRKQEEHAGVVKVPLGPCSQQPTAIHPLQKPTRLLRAALWAREESCRPRGCRRGVAAARFCRLHCMVTTRHAYETSVLGRTLNVGSLLYGVAREAAQGR